ncbi:hypothetical protein VCHA47P369_70069 [Vibrio chagasii]|nr:hypothetical protein VCHA34P112_160122 [Vibrio chagasii]CAH6880243.1 hypothetical protein VCHA29O37_290018 [Vibrio chagasii]CAH7017226.1 hypothetical protein VCHA50O407_170018 [Vibrio chagasii]CAH7039851.1 hypothetical protein VCHA53O463_160018 [Vibrio chagasii]CAH7094094.1 hypothetical protein VCHA56P515_200089 [Vibrio chagasii]
MYNKKLLEIDYYYQNENITHSLFACPLPLCTTIYFTRRPQI